MPRYNGWANRATWNVALWLGNDEGLYRAMLESFAGVRPTAARAEEFARATIGDMTPDGDDLDDVRWSEIARFIRENME